MNFTSAWIWRWRRALAAWPLLLLCVGALAQGDPDPEPEPDPHDGLPAPVFTDTTGQADLRWDVEHPEWAGSLYQAERTIYRTIQGEDITYHYGNVYIDRDTVVVRADSAHVYEQRDLVRLFDNVRMRHLETRVACDRAEYRHEAGVADLWGHVRVLEDDALITSRRGELRDQMQLTRLFQDAVLVSPDYTVLADTLLRDRRREHAEAGQ